MHHRSRFCLPQLFCLAICLLVMLFVGESKAKGQEQSLPDDLKMLFKTMDELSPTGIWDKPLVRLVFVGSTDAEGNRESYFEYGIPIEQSQQNVSIWNSILQVQQFPLRNAKELEHSVEKVEVVTLKDQVRFFQQSHDVEFRRWLHPLSAVFWARVAHAQGEFALRDEQVEKAKSLLKDLPASLLKDRTPLSYLEQDVIPYEEYLRIVRSFERTSIPHDKILEDLIRLVRMFPTFTKIRQATQLRDDVQSIVNEGAERKSIKDVDSLPLKERIGELIYQLRNQDPAPLFRLRFRKFAPIPIAMELERETCWKLYSLGMDAVPQLIDAISDTRPSRIVEHPKIFANTAEVLSIGFCAEYIIWQISEDNPGSLQIPNAECKLAERQATYRAWYAKVNRNSSR